MSLITADADGLETLLRRAGRSPAASRLKASGLPHRRLEAWRYTPVKTLQTQNFAPSEAPSEQLIAQARLVQPALKGQISSFLNGTMVAGQACPHTRTALPSHDMPFTDAAHASPMGLLNAALRQQGVSLLVADGQDGGTISLASHHACSKPISTHLHHAIELAADARLVVIDYASGEGAYLANPFYDIKIGARAHLTHIRVIEDGLDAETFGIVNVGLAENAAYESFTLVQGGKLSRQEVYAQLNGEGAQVHVNGVQLLGSGQVGDLTSVITHVAPQCQSRQTVANVLSGRGRGVFQGKVVVKPGAQKTDGFQMNQALLLSTEAEINSKPELEIYADDVKCSHGATVGALDDTQLFYLRSRGIPEAQARDLLVDAFLAEVIGLAPSEDIISFLQARVSTVASLRARS